MGCLETGPVQKQLVQIQIVLIQINVNRGFPHNMQICARMRTAASVWQKM